MPSGPLPTPPSEVPAEEPFWRRKTLDEMSPGEWESLCDGCGRCCLVKLEDEDTGRVHYTDVGCTLLDGETCRCRDYPDRQRIVPDCLRLTPDAVRSVGWLPPTCAYRLVREGRDLYWWHPLVSGDPDAIHEAGISIQGRLAGPEEAFSPSDLMDRIVTWPESAPARRRRGREPR